MKVEHILIQEPSDLTMSEEQDEEIEFLNSDKKAKEEAMLLMDEQPDKLNNLYTRLLELKE